MKQASVFVQTLRKREEDDGDSDDGKKQNCRKLSDKSKWIIISNVN